MVLAKYSKSTNDRKLIFTNITVDIKFSFKYVEYICFDHLEKQSTQKTFSRMIPTNLVVLMSVATLVEVKRSLYLHIFGLT